MVKKTAYAATVTHKARAITAKIEKGALPVPSRVQEVPVFAQGMTGIKKTSISLTDLLASLAECWRLSTEADDGNALGTIFKAACRVDEMFFAKNEGIELRS